MIGLRDTGLLALTKLRTRKIRTGITILLASLLFGALVAASLVTTGIFRSVDSFRADGLTSKYIVGVSEAHGNMHVLRDASLIAKAKQRYGQLVEKKQSEAKRLGVDYIKAADQPPYTARTTNGDEMLVFNDTNGIVQELLKEKFSSQSTFDMAKFHTLADKYGAIKTFTTSYYYPSSNSFDILPKTGEKFYDQSNEAAVNANYQKPILDGNFTIAPKILTSPYTLPDDGGWKPSSGTMPIILPQNKLEQLLGLKKLPSDASASTKLHRLKTVRKRAETFTYKACFRNKTSQDLIQQTIVTNAAIAAHKDDASYQVPALQYKLPNPYACAEPTVSSDTRTASEKQHDENQAIFDEEFNDKTKPESYFISFKVVGVAPAEKDGQSQSNTHLRNIDDALSALLTTDGIGVTIPQSMYDRIPDKSKYADILSYRTFYLFGNEDNKQHFVQFANAADAQKFIKEQGCTPQYDNTCKPAGRPYIATLDFSNSAALDDIHVKVTRWLGYLAIGVVVLAVIVMWIAIGRTITDGRHETAVFRAIGFKRIDIAAVYVLYALLLSILVAFFALVLGFIGAAVLDHTVGPTLTAQAQYGFGGIDLTKTISTIGIDARQLGLIMLACIVTGCISSIVPLLRNVRRNPIHDMREE